MKQSQIFIFDNEDYTLGHMLQEELLTIKGVIYAGYIIEHPLENHLKVKISTESDLMETPILPSDDITGPEIMLDIAIKNLINRISNIEKEFNKVI
jgi:DNA-directed RNA polymerase subunit L